MFETVELQIIPKGDAPVVHCSQYDTNRLIRFTIMNGDDPMTFANLVSITTTIRKVDGNLWKYEDNSPVIVSGNYDVFTDEQMTACSGNNIGELTIRYTDSDITDEDIKISTLNFILKVELSPECGGLVSQSDISNLSGQIALIVNEQLGNYYTKSEIDDQIEDIVTEQVTPIVADIVSEQVPPIVEQELSNYYTKDNVDTYFYNKDETDALLSDKADTSDLPDMTDYYTKSDTDTLLSGKVSTSALNNYYTKSEVDALVGTFDIIDTESGSMVTFDNGGDDIPVKEFITDIEVSEDGFTEVDIVVIGKNFLEPTLLTSATVNGITFTLLSDGTVKANGTATANAVLMVNSIIGGNLLDNLLPLDNVSCIGSGCPNVSGCRISFARMNGSSFFDDVGSGVSFTVGNITSSTNAYVRLQVDSGYTVNDVIFNPMIRLASEVDGTYEPYNGTTYPILLGETLTQGGTLNVTTGLLTRTDETTSQLTATAVNTLSGLNNIHSSTGDVSVTYFNNKADQIAALINVLGGN